MNYKENLMLRILLIEDSPEDKKLFVRLINKIENVKFEIDWAQTIGKAKEILHHTNFDAVITDLGLPDGNGVAGLKNFEDDVKRQPFIVLTGQDDDSLLQKVGHLGVLDYLVKSELTPSLLRRSIHYSMSRFSSEKEQGILNKQLRKSQRIELLGKITGGISHDVNNKLAIILGNVEILAKCNLNAEASLRVDKIRKTLEKTSNLTRQLLAFGRKQELHKERLDIVKVVTDSLALLDRVTKSSISLKSKFPDEPLYSKVDITQIDQVVMNLVLNAQDAIGDRTGEIFVSVDIVLKKNPNSLIPNEPKEFIRIKVSDNGCGMSKRVKEKILDPFFTTKEEGKGVGLGLSVVDGIVNQHSGFMDIESEEGIGTSFLIYLPKSTSIEKKKERKREKEIIVEDLVVLYVEDEPELSELTVDLFEDKGFKVLLALNGKEALDIYKQHSSRIDVVLTDVVMPKMNGKVLCDNLREIDPNLGIVFVSGYSQTELTKGTGSLPENTKFHPKPFDIEDVTRSLVELGLKRRDFHKKKAS